MALNLIEMRAEFQDPMRQGVVDMLWQASKVMQFIYFIPHNGLAYPYTKRKALPGVGFRSLNATFTPTVGVINPDIETLAILGGKIRTDSIQISLKGDKARTNEIAAQIDAAGKFFDKNFLVGDPATNPNGFTGLKKRLGGTQLLTNSTNGAAIVVDKVLALQNAVNGPNTAKILFMNQTNRQNLVSACLETANLNMAKYIEFDTATGFYKFNGSLIVEVYFDEAEQAILPFTEVCGTSGAACSSVYCVLFGKSIDETGVQGITGLADKIQTKGPFDYGEYMEDVQQMVAGIGLFGGYVAARLQGCKAA